MDYNKIHFLGRRHHFKYFIKKVKYLIICKIPKTIKGKYFFKVSVKYNE